MADIFDFQSDDRLITFNELAAAMNCHKQTVVRMVADGRLPEPVRLGSRRFWRKSKLDTLFNGVASKSKAG